MSIIEYIPHEILYHVFSFMDGSSFWNVSCTCHLWNDIVNQKGIWPHIVDDFLSKWKPEEDFPFPPLEALGDMVEGDLEDDTKYRILNTCYVVVPQRDGNEEEITTINEGLVDLVQKTQHTLLRRNRVFGSLGEAVARCKSGDWVYLQEGTYKDNITINHPVNITGEFRPQKSGGKVTKYLYVRFEGELVCKNYQGDSVLSNMCLVDNGQITVSNAGISGVSIIFGNLSTIHIDDMGSARFLNSSFLPNVNRINLKDTFHNLSLENCSVRKCISEDVFSTLLSRLKTALENNEIEVMVGVLKTFHDVISGDVDLSEKVEESDYVDVVFNILYSVLDGSVVIAVANAIRQLASYSSEKINEILGQKNVLPRFEIILKHNKDDEKVQVGLFPALFSLVNLPQYRRHFKNNELYELLIGSLNDNKKSTVVCFSILSLLWHCAHLIDASREAIQEGIPVICEVMDEQLDYESVQAEACGVFWNLEHEWSEPSRRMVIPRVLRSIKSVTESDYAHTMLGFLLKFLKACPEADVNFIVDEEGVGQLLDLKLRFKDEKEDSNMICQIWKLLSWLAAVPRARKEIASKVSDKERYGLLTVLDKTKIMRLLAIQDEVEGWLIELISDTIEETESPEVFFYALDAVIHLAHNKRIPSSLNKDVKGVGEVLLEKSRNFLKHERIREWVGWAEQELHDTPHVSYYHINPHTAVELNVASDGLTCRGDFSSSFASGLGTASVKTGKWYYEVEIRSDQLYQFGWANEKFSPVPNLGLGVGDDEDSWSMDLYRHAKWHKDEDSSSLPYGKEVTRWEVGGVVQCFLDLNNKEMSFGYNGTHLGVAFTDFEISKGLYPAFSTMLENECKFNFGSTPMRYKHEGFLPLHEHKPDS